MHPELRKAYENVMAPARHCYHAGDDAAAMVHLDIGMFRRLPIDPAILRLLDK